MFTIPGHCYSCNFLISQLRVSDVSASYRYKSRVITIVMTIIKVILVLVTYSTSFI